MTGVVIFMDESREESDTVNNGHSQQNTPQPEGIPIPIDSIRYNGQLVPTRPEDIPIPINTASMPPLQSGGLPDDIPIVLPPLYSDAAITLPDGISIVLTTNSNSPGPLIQPPPVPLDAVVVAEKVSKYVTDGGGVKDASFKLFKGKVTCIAGRDEDGASSLFRILAFEDMPTTGRVTILNQDLSLLSLEERKNWFESHILYIRQSHLELVEQTGHLLIAYWLHYYENLKWSEAKNVARQALKNVGMSHHKGDVSFRELSPDEQARVSIAKVCARNNRNQAIYLFDDLFTSLDEQTVKRLIELLRDVARRGKAVVVQTNRQDILADFDHVLLMQNEELQLDQLHIHH